MTQDEIIEMARQVGFWKEHPNTWMCNSQDIEAFAKLVAEKAVDDYLTLEREAELKARGEA